MPLTTEIVASLIVFLFTTILTIAGVGAAFIIIPAFFWLGVPLKEAMATALLLNGISMSIASITFIKNRLVAFGTAVPIIIVASALSPLGAYSTKFVSRDTLLWLFVGFLIFAGSMMLFFKAKKREVHRSHSGAKDWSHRGRSGRVSWRTAGGRRGKLHCPGSCLAGV